MAAFAHTDCVLVINSVDLSDHVISAEWNESYDTEETVASSDTDVTVAATFGRGSLSVELQQDTAAASTYATMIAAIGTTVTCTYKATSAATSATNPQQSASFVITEFTQGGQIGPFATSTSTWPRTGAVTRATS